MANLFINLPRRRNSLTEVEPSPFILNQILKQHQHHQQQQQQQSSQLADSRSTKSIAQQKYTTTYVIKRGYFNLVRCLLSLGIDPNQVEANEPLARTSLIYTTFIRDEKWSLSVARNLLECGADLKQTDSRFLTPIHYCCAFGKLALLRLFLDSLDFDLSKSIDLNGNTCMHYAIRSHNLKCVQMLLDKYKSGHMGSRANLMNIFGLRPSQVEMGGDVDKNKKSICDGTDSIETCKEELLNFINEISSQMKLEEVY